MSYVQTEIIIKEILKLEKDNLGYELTDNGINFDRGYLISFLSTFAELSPDLANHIKNRYEMLTFMQDNK